MRDPPPPRLDLDLTVRSHGWYDLAPWAYDAERRVLGRPLLVLSRAARSTSGERAQVLYAEMAQHGGAGAKLSFRLEADGAPSSAARGSARAAMRVCLALDEDFSPFYQRISELEANPPRSLRRPRLRWVVKRGAGRILRSPTVFEDAVKTLCTTNCSWALTRVMVANLVERLGEPGPRGLRAFPTPDAMARRPERFYRESVRAGYRAPFLVKLARAVASGRIDIESWRDSPLSTDELAERIRALDGFGPYATENLLKLLGRYDRLALDSWSRATVARLYGRRRPPSDATVMRWYAPYGKYAGLAFWFDVTADWHRAPPAES